MVLQGFKNLIEPWLRRQRQLRGYNFDRFPWLTEERRRWLTYGILAGGAVMPLLVLAIAAMIPDTTYDAPPQRVYFYDLGTGDLFVGSSQDAPPVAAPSGQQVGGFDAGVRAFVFSCGKCNPANQFVGYLMRYSPRYQRLYRDTPADQRDKALADLVNSADHHEGEYFAEAVLPPKWLASSTREAGALLEYPAQRCGGWSNVRTCYP